MRNSLDTINELSEMNKNISGRRSIRENFNYEGISSRKKLNNNEDRSISEPPQSRYTSSYINNHNTQPTTRLKPIREKLNDNPEDSSDEEEEENFSKSNSQLNESDLDLEIPESASQTPTPTPLGTGNARRINSETNLNDSKRRLTGFMGNKSKRFCASTSELSFSSHLDTNKSLFSPKNNRSRTGSLYGSNVSLNSTNSRLFMMNSPFYNGKTMFGGASAYPRRDINQHKVLRTPVQMRPSSSLSNSSVTSTKSEGGIVPESNAAKRILEIMTQFSGPLKETRSMGNNINSMIKIPGLVQNKKRYGEEELNLDRSIALTRPTAPYSRPIGTSKNIRSESPSLLLNSTNSPQIPTMSQLLKMKKLQNNTERVREIANRSESFLNQVQEYKLPSTVASEVNTNSASASTMGTSSSSLKMKNNITKNLLRNERGSNIELPPAPLNLPNIQLPELKSIPKFDIQIPISKASTSNTDLTTAKANFNAATSKSISSSFNFTATTVKTAPTISTTFNQPKETIIKPNSNFSFSKPVRIDSEEIDVSKLKTLTDSFKFSKPVPFDVTTKNATEISLTKKDSPVSADNLFKNLVAQQKSQWECEFCLTRNASDKTKCLCCEAVRPDSGVSSSSSSLKDTSPVKATAVASDDLFKNLAAQQKKSQWECDMCMTKNDVGKDKCACCETPKPGAKTSSNASSTLFSSSNTSTFKFGMPSNATTTNMSSDSSVKKVASDDLFKNLAAQQKTQWECNSCMTRNDDSKDKCMCCETPKPGSKPAVSSQTSSFTFGIKPSTTDSTGSTGSSQPFQFGMPLTQTTSDPIFKKIVEKQGANWECSACMTKNDQSRSKCVCCEQVKPGSTEKQSDFSFGSKSIAPSTSSSVLLPKPSEVKFSFGVPATKSESAAPSETKTVESDKVEKKDEVDKPKTAFSFGIKPANEHATDKAATTETPATIPTFTFKAPSPTASATNVSAAFTLKSSAKSDEQKEEDAKKTEDVKEKESEKPPTSLFAFGKFESPKTTEVVKFGAEKKEEEPKEKPKALGGFSFPITTPAQPTFGSQPNMNTNGGFSFGGFSKTETTKSEAASSNTTATTTASLSGSFKFSSGSTNLSFTKSCPLPEPVTAPAQSSNTFSFGTPKADAVATKPIFGTFSSSATTPAIQSTTTTATPFGGLSTTAPAPAEVKPTSAPPLFGSTPSGFAFGSNKEENKAPVFAFGSNTNAVAPANTNLFGNSSPAVPSVTPVFGSTPIFGSTTATGANATNNNERGFGSKMPGFGSFSSSPSNQPQKRSFDFGSSNPSDVPQTKKFDFASQPAQTNSTPFQFNAQANAPEARPAFSFTNPSTPQTFSFSAGSNANNNPQTQQSSQQPVVPNIGMPFNVQAPTVAIPGINTFSAQGNAAPNRKILKASRRTNLTRR